jgi:hypothetical protein
LYETPETYIETKCTEKKPEEVSSCNRTKNNTKR